MSNRERLVLVWLEHFTESALFWIAGIGLDLIFAALYFNHHWRLWWFGVWTLAMFVLAGIHAFRKTQHEVAEQKQTTEIAVPPAAAAIEAFYRTYDNAILTEVEQSISQQAALLPNAADKERFLTRTAATILIVSIFEQTWLTIYGSQLEALYAINGRPYQIEDLRPFYDKAVAANTQLASYPFTSWLGYMKTQVLVRENGTQIVITIRGKEFLKWLAETGKTGQTRIN